MYGNTKAGSDPASYEYANEMKDCLDVSNSWPRARSTATQRCRLHGRHMISSMREEVRGQHVCAKYLMQQHLERMYGSGPTKPGMPEDKYDGRYGRQG